MKSAHQFLIIFGAAALLGAMPAAAQQGDMWPGGKARVICRDERGPWHMACLVQNAPAPDCSQVSGEQKPHCEAIAKTFKACKDKKGGALLKCVEANRPPPPSSGGPGGMVGPPPGPPPGN